MKSKITEINDKNYIYGGAKIATFRINFNDFTCKCGGRFTSDNGVTIHVPNYHSFPIKCNKCQKSSRITFILDNYIEGELK